MGRLIYIVGASGAGKDSLIAYVRERFSVLSTKTVFAHRYITRPAAAGGENHVALSSGEFKVREDAGLFSLCWHSHGMGYGIGLELDSWLERGFSAVVNGSRGYLEQAVQRYPDLVPVSIEVSHDVLRSRLLARGRESEAEIEARLLRAQEYRVLKLRGLRRINNDGALEEAGQQLLGIVLNPESGAELPISAWPTSGRQRNAE
ncbi:MAG: phosphonate metabolism protein/1,5-bisphosphokinase (PRPP-forming) PhnN [Candidatus Sedimenticola sp. PURPLELP]